MHSLRRSLPHRLIVLLLAAAMPLCCCFVKSIAAVPEGGAPATVVAACCYDSSNSCDDEEQSSESDSCGACCCVKAMNAIDDWTPPSDEIGLPLPLIAMASTLISGGHDSISITGQDITGHPPPGPWGLSAPALRHATILQV